MVLSPNFSLPEISRKNNFNFLRLLLAYFVVIFHSVVLPGNTYPYLRIFDGHIAVSGFFIISGFLIIRSYWTSKSVMDYFIKRCKRLLPAYVLVVFLCGLGLFFLSNISIENYFKSPLLLKYFVSNLLFLNFLQPTVPGVFSQNLVQSVNGSLWTIKVEVSFYLVVPFLAYLLNIFKTKRAINWFLAGLYLFGLVYNFGLLSLSEKTGNNFYSILAHQLPGFIQYFVVGVFYAINFDFIKKYEKYLLIPAIGIVAFYYFAGNEYFLPIGLGIILMFLAFGFSFLNDIGKNGDYSYGVYLFHFPIIQILIALGYFQLNPAVSMLLTLGTVFSVAYLSWHLLEKRVLKK
jgi:peptidoglycan/LPS O-acetylase OafA/YrhL